MFFLFTARVLILYSEYCFLIKAQTKEYSETYHLFAFNDVYFFLI